MNAFHLRFPVAASDTSTAAGGFASLSAFGGAAGSVLDASGYVTARLQALCKQEDERAARRRERGNGRPVGQLLMSFRRNHHAAMPVNTIT